MSRVRVPSLTPPGGGPGQFADQGLRLCRRRFDVLLVRRDDRSTEHGQRHAELELPLRRSSWSASWIHMTATVLRADRLGLQRRGPVLSPPGTIGGVVATTASLAGESTGAVF